jgi:hypothetical protein
VIQSAGLVRVIQCVRGTLHLARECPASGERDNGGRNKKQSFHLSNLLFRVNSSRKELDSVHVVGLIASGKGGYQYLEATNGTTLVDGAIRATGIVRLSILHCRHHE